jgi:hypothetical protein
MSPKINSEFLEFLFLSKNSVSGLKCIYPSLPVFDKIPPKTVIFYT